MAMSEYQRKRFEHIMNGRPLAEKKHYKIPHKSAKRIAKEKEQKKALAGADNELTEWFKEKCKSLKGVCSHCGQKTNVKGTEYEICTVAHVLPKSTFPSIATHESNSIELCFWNNACHGNLDSGALSLTDLNCWDEVVEKFQAMYPFIDKKERRRIPEVLMQYVEIDT